MGITVPFYKLFQFKADLAAIFKRYCCHGNVTYKFILTTVTLLTCSPIQINLLDIIATKNNCSDIFFSYFSILLKSVGRHPNYKYEFKYNYQNKSLRHNYILQDTETTNKLFQ